MESHLNGKRSAPWRVALSYLACYGIWLGLSGLGVWTLLLLRDGLLSLLPIIGPWVMSAVDKYGFVLFGLLLLIWILYTEDALRRSVERRELGRQALRLAVVQFAALILAYAFPFLSLPWT